MNKVKIAILLATYNGAHYLAEQIDSILEQSNRDWHLFIHDDGSSDGTMDVVSEYQRHYPDIISVMSYDAQGGPCANFMSMLRLVEADYYMFADQDDVWLKDKIAMTLTKIESAQAEKGKDKPIVAHTDLYVVDEKLNILSNSLWKDIAARPDFVHSFKDCVICYVTGCAMMFNAAAKQSALSHDMGKATMHDAWIVDCVWADGGFVLDINTPSVYYRQHSNNTLGVANGVASRLTLVYRITHLLEMQKTNLRILTMLQSIAPFSLLDFIKAKARYKKYLKKDIEK